MKKNIVRLNESQLKKIIAESVREVLKEWEKPEDWQETQFKGTYTDKDGALYMPDDDIPEDEEVKIDYEDEFRKAVQLITKNLFCEEPVFGKNDNGFSFCDIEFPELSLSLRLYCYNERTGELGARLDDEYGTNLYDYVTATQGAPMGYIDKRDGVSLAKKIISDIREMEKNNEED